MRLGGTVCCEHPAEWENRLVQSGFRAITAPFTCDTPREETERLLRIIEKHDTVIAEVGVWRNPFDPAEGSANLDYAVRQLQLAEDLSVPCCVNIAGTESPFGWDAADPGNFSDSMYRRLVASIREIIDRVNPKKTFYCLEPMPWMIPDSPEVYLQLMRDVDREQFAVHMDFVNMINCPRRFPAFLRYCEDVIRNECHCHCKGQQSAYHQSFYFHLVSFLHHSQGDPMIVITADPIIPYRSFTSAENSSPFPAVFSFCCL